MVSSSGDGSRQVAQADRECGIAQCGLEASPRSAQIAGAIGLVKVLVGLAVHERQRGGSGVDHRCKLTRLPRRPAAAPPAGRVVFAGVVGSP